MITLNDTNIAEIFNKIFGWGLITANGDNTHCEMYVPGFGECELTALQMEPIGRGQIAWTLHVFDRQLCASTSTNEFSSMESWINEDIASVLRIRLQDKLSSLRTSLDI
jgi:hypothetical protein